MVGLAVKLRELPRKPCVVASITATLRRQHLQCRLVSLLGCCGLIDCGLVISEDGI